MNRKFFYEQYDKIRWANQEKTKTNFEINKFIIRNIIEKKKKGISVFEIGFGIGTFIKMLLKAFGNRGVTIEGCEPSKRSYRFFMRNYKEKLKIKAYNSVFLKTETGRKFDFITAILVFPHFLPDDLEKTAGKIASMLEKGGKFIMAVSSESKTEEKIQRGLLVKRSIIILDGKKYRQVLHYSDINGIGRVMDYDREDKLYINLFKKYGLGLAMKTELDKGATTLFVFQKAAKISKKLKEDLDFAKRTEAAMKIYEKGGFIEMECNKFLEEVKKW